MLKFLARLLGATHPEPASGARSPRWPQVRAAHLKTEPACVACGRTVDVEVHHVVPVAEALRRGRPDLELDPTNLITLCADPCHLVHGHLMSWSRWSPSVRADAAAYRARLDAARRRPS